MKKIYFGILLMSLLIFANSARAENVSYENRTLGDASITIDGSDADWADVEGVNLTLKSPAASGSYTMTFKAAHDDTNMYFLLTVEDKYYFPNLDTGVAHHAAPALGIAFPISEGVNVEHMGAVSDHTDEDLNTTSGMVDIMHWEMEVKAGVKTSGETTNADNDPGHGTAGLDDEYANTPFDRHDDKTSTANNLWAGAWSHTGDGTNGSDGSWVFELSRDLASSDETDASFAEGDSTEVAVAFWSPNENDEHSWTDDGHYINEDNLVEMDFSTKAVGAPGFGLYLSLLSVFALATIVKRRK